MEDKVYYQKGKYILYGNPELRNGKIVCKFYNKDIGNYLLRVLNNDITIE